MNRKLATLGFSFVFAVGGMAVPSFAKHHKGEAPETHKSGNDKSPETRYSPGRIKGSTVEFITGEPDVNHISTSYVERQNLTMRMNMRRMTRLTNGFSRKIENHAAATALHFASSLPSQSHDVFSSDAVEGKFAG